MHNLDDIFINAFEGVASAETCQVLHSAVNGKDRSDHFLAKIMNNFIGTAVGKNVLKLIHCLIGFKFHFPFHFQNSPVRTNSAGRNRVKANFSRGPATLELDVCPMVSVVPKRI